MSKMFYRPKEAWVGDLVPYYEEGMYYAFYLHDPRKYDGKFAEDTTWHCVTTKDFVEVDYKGEAIKRGGDEAPNKNIYTGSIIKDELGIYHAFYTAYNENFKTNGRSIQSVMQATGTDLTKLSTMENFIFQSDGDRYEEFDWRDPYVFWDEAEECYKMLLASRVKGAGELRGGCISLSRSHDLINWTYEEPFYYPQMYITMECPEVFRMGEYWYLVFSTFSDQFTTHYRYSKTLEGPWIIPEDDVFDTRANYAIKTASDGERRFAFGWIASKRNNNDFEPWEWGGTMVFHEIKKRSDSPELYVVPTESVKQMFTQTKSLEVEVLYNATFTDEFLESDTLGAALYDSPTTDFIMSCTVEVESAHEFGLVLHSDEGLEKGYFLRMNPRTSTIAWDFWPRREKGFYQWQIAGDVPYQVETQRRLPKGNVYQIKLIREGDISVLYINDEVALSTRMYNHQQGKIGVYVVQGKMKVLDFSTGEM